MERFNFLNSEFKSDAPGIFSQLWKENDFTNVTLVSSDEVSTMVHKVILATASPVLKRILIKNPHHHPLVFFNSIGSAVLEQLVKFIYLGECDVDQKNLVSFLDAGKSLQIRGLVDNALDEGSQKSDGSEICGAAVDQVSKVEPGEGSRGSEFAGGGLLLDNPHIDTKDNVDVQKKVNEPSKPFPKVKEEIGSLFKIEHIGDEEVLRITGSDKSYRDLFKNKEGKFQCNQCDYAQVKRFGEMVNHIKAVHEGFKLSCELCDFQTGYKRCLIEHIKIIHEGKLKHCKECSFTAKNRSSLSIHMTKHKFKESMWRAKKTGRQCSKCEYSSESVKYMKKHILENHL